LLTYKYMAEVVEETTRNSPRRERKIERSYASTEWSKRLKRSLVTFGQRPTGSGINTVSSGQGQEREVTSQPAMPQRRTRKRGFAKSGASLRLNVRPTSNASFGGVSASPVKEKRSPQPNAACPSVQSQATHSRRNLFPQGEVGRVGDQWSLLSQGLLLGC
jgi:hypothetical protein